jgi:hypothetical protein
MDDNLSSFSKTSLTSPKNSENPKINRFLDEFRSTNCRFDSPTAEIMPNMTMKRPPTMGVGIVMKQAPNLQKRPNTSMMSAAHWITRREPTWNEEGVVST